MVVGAVTGLVAIGLVAVTVFFDGYMIPSGAMEPTLEIGDRVLARPIDADEVSRGDLVVFTGPDLPGAASADLLLRVVAVAGDEVGGRDGFLTIDGERVTEPYLPPDVPTPAFAETVVPAGHVFVLGDNRLNSAGSNVFGPLAHDDVIALVVPRWSPLREFGGF